MQEGKEARDIRHDAVLQRAIEIRGIAAVDAHHDDRALGPAVANAIESTSCAMSLVFPQITLDARALMH